MSPARGSGGTPGGTGALGTGALGRATAVDRAAPDERPDDPTRLGRAVARRLRRPGPRLGTPRPSPIGSVASSSVRFARGWGRSVEIRRALAGPATPIQVRARDDLVRPPRWWTPRSLGHESTTVDDVESRARGLPLMVRRIPADPAHQPGAARARYAPVTVRVRVTEDVRAAGRMTTAADHARPRSASAIAGPAARGPGAPAPPGRDGGSGRASSTEPRDGQVTRAPMAGRTTTGTEYGTTTGSAGRPAVVTAAALASSTGPGGPTSPGGPTGGSGAADPLGGVRPAPSGRFLRRRALASAVARARRADAVVIETREARGRAVPVIHGGAVADAPGGGAVPVARGSGVGAVAAGGTDRAPLPGATVPTRTAPVEAGGFVRRRAFARAAVVARRAQASTPASGRLPGAAEDVDRPDPGVARPPARTSAGSVGAAVPGLFPRFQPRAGGVGAGPSTEPAGAWIPSPAVPRGARPSPVSSGRLVRRRVLASAAAARRSVAARRPVAAPAFEPSGPAGPEPLPAMRVRRLMGSAGRPLRRAVVAAPTIAGDPTAALRRHVGPWSGAVAGRTGPVLGLPGQSEGRTPRSRSWTAGSGTRGPTSGGPGTGGATAGGATEPGQGSRPAAVGVRSPGTDTAGAGPAIRRSTPSAAPSSSEATVSSGATVSFATTAPLAATGASAPAGLPTSGTEDPQAAPSGKPSSVGLTGMAEVVSVGGPTVAAPSSGTGRGDPVSRWTGESRWTGAAIPTVRRWPAGWAAVPPVGAVIRAPSRAAGTMGPQGAGPRVSGSVTARPGGVLRGLGIERAEVRRATEPVRGFSGALSAPEDIAVRDARGAVSGRAWHQRMALGVTRGAHDAAPDPRVGRRLDGTAVRPGRPGAVAPVIRRLSPRAAASVTAAGLGTTNSRGARASVRRAALNTGARHAGAESRVGAPGGTLSVPGAIVSGMSRATTRVVATSRPVVGSLASSSWRDGPLPNVSRSVSPHDPGAAVGESSVARRWGDRRGWPATAGPGLVERVGGLGSGRGLGIGLGVVHRATRWVLRAGGRLPASDDIAVRTNAAALAVRPATGVAASPAVPRSHVQASMPRQGAHHSSVAEDGRPGVVGAVVRRSVRRTSTPGPSGPITRVRELRAQESGVPGVRVSAPSGAGVWSAVSGHGGGTLRRVTAVRRWVDVADSARTPRRSVVRHLSVVRHPGSLASVGVLSQAGSAWPQRERSGGHGRSLSDSGVVRGLGIELAPVRRATRWAQRSKAGAWASTSEIVPAGAVRGAAVAPAVRRYPPAPGRSASVRPSHATIPPSGSARGLSAPSTVTSDAGTPTSLLPTVPPGRREPDSARVTVRRSAVPPATRRGPDTSAGPAGLARWEIDAPVAPGPGHTLRLLSTTTIRPATGASTGPAHVAPGVVRGLDAREATRPSGGTRGARSGAAEEAPTGAPIRRSIQRIGPPLRPVAPGSPGVPPRRGTDRPRFGESTTSPRAGVNGASPAGGVPPGQRVGAHRPTGTDASTGTRPWTAHPLPGPAPALAAGPGIGALPAAWAVMPPRTVVRRSPVARTTAEAPVRRATPAPVRPASATSPLAALLAASGAPGAVRPPGSGPSGVGSGSSGRGTGSSGPGFHPSGSGAGSGTSWTAPPGALTPPDLRRYTDRSGPPGGFEVNAPFGPVDGVPPATSRVAGDRDDLARDVEARVLARLEAWKREELDDHVLRLVEDRLQEETERRSWRRGTEVF